NDVRYGCDRLRGARARMTRSRMARARIMRGRLAHTAHPGGENPDAAPLAERPATAGSSTYAQATWRDRARYRIDEFFGRGTIALILGLFIVSALIIVIV